MIKMLVQVECLVEWAAWVEWVEWVCNSRLSRLKNYKTPVVKHFGGFFMSAL
jgi:hypothetical protein